MENTIKKYTEQLARYKENRSQTVDTNTDAENELYDRLITQLASFVRDLKLIDVTHSSLPLRNESKSFFNVKNLADLKRLYPNGNLYTASLVDGYVKYFVDEKLVITKALMV